MRILLVEDEYQARQNLLAALQPLLPEAKIVGQTDSVSATVDWLGRNPPPDLVFLDIQLADGLSFEIFDHGELTCPVIFTTAFDQYALRAFKLNSIDYLLKPIEPEELRAALDKFRRQQLAPVARMRDLLSGIGNPTAPQYRQRFLIKRGRGLGYLPVSETTHLYGENGLVYAVDAEGRRHVIDLTLERAETELDPNDFFRINRAQLIHLASIEKIHTWFNHRLKLELRPATDLESVVSRDRVKSFKAWLDR